MNVVTSKARGGRWLGVLVALLVVLLGLSVAAVAYTAGLGPDRSDYEVLSDLATVIQANGLSDTPEGGGGLALVRAKVAQVGALSDWAAIVVSDPRGRIAAAWPEGAAGMNLPALDWPFYSELPEPWPELDLWNFERPSALGQALSLEGKPGDYAEIRRQVKARDGLETVAYVFAVVPYSKFLGVSSRDWSRLLTTVSLALFSAATLALAAWVYADARRRRLEAPLAWGVLTLVTNAIGWATYLVVRAWQRPSCPNCGTALRPSYRACPACGLQVRRACPACGQAVLDEWSFCPHCTAELH